MPGEKQLDEPPQGPSGDLSVWLATGLGLGYSPFAPGTVGAIWGLPLAWLIGQIRLPVAYGSLAAQLAVIAALFLVGVPICSRAARFLGKSDPGAVVWDEIASMPITFLFIPWDQLSLKMTATVLMLGFLWHRVFDIAKPPPCRQVERLHGGLGIMADDTFAAAYAGIALHGCLWIWHAMAA